MLLQFYIALYTSKHFALLPFTLSLFFCNTPFGTLFLACASSCAINPNLYMNVYVFGGASSLSCSNYALRKTAADNETKYGTKVAEILRNNFYVDDMLKSVSNEETAIKLIRGIRKICADGGFHLTKFASNNKQVLASIPEDQHRKSVFDQDLECGMLPTEKAMGIYWNIEEDNIGFEVRLKEKPNTKRGMLSVVSSIYDPLGLVSPFILEGRQIVQKLCFSKFNWDEPVNEDIKQQWQNWMCKLKTLKDIKSGRCYKPAGFGKVVSCSLHYFSDASERGYGQATYIRLVNQTGKIHCSLVMGKSTVAPMKYTSIPRLELTAAVLSVKMAGIIKKELATDHVSEYFWTDS